MSTDPKRWVAGHVAGLPRSGIRDFFELVAKMKGQGVISLGVGEPDFVTPWHIREAAIFALERGKTYYTSNLGLLELRRAIADYVAEHFGIGYRPEDQIIVTVGVSEALDIAFRAFCNPGDKVMFHQPCYVSYHPSISLVHGQAVPVPTCAKDDFALTAEALCAAWQPGCKILMLKMREQYHRRRDWVVRRFNEMGLKCHSPRGSFYAFPDVSASGLDEGAFAVGLLEHHKVAVVPGSAFGENGRGHVRACFATAHDQLVEACDRMERYMESVRR